MSDVVSGWVDSTLASCIKLTLTHFLWQGMWWMGAALRGKSVNARYSAFVGSLLSMAVCAALTFGLVSVQLPSESVARVRDESSEARSSAFEAVEDSARGFDEDGGESPRETVAQFLRLIKRGKGREAWGLTLPDSDTGWGPELTDLRQYDRIRPLHRASSGDHAIVISNIIPNNADQPTVFFALLKKHDGMWRIDRHEVTSPNDVRRVLEGFNVHPTTTFDVIREELVGRWGVNVCEYALTLALDGTGTQLPVGPAGPEPGAKPESFRWQVKGNTLTRRFTDREEIEQIDWVDDESVRSMGANGRVKIWDRVGQQPERDTTRKDSSVHLKHRSSQDLRSSA